MIKVYQFLRSSVKVKHDALEVLNAARTLFTLKEISAMVGVRESLLSRYASGEVAPSRERAEAMLEALTKHDFLKEFLRRGLKKEGWSFPSLIGRPDFLELVSMYIYSMILDVVAGTRLDAVVTFKDESSLLASLVSTRLDVRVVTLDEGDVRGSVKTSFLSRVLRRSRPICVAVSGVFDSVKASLLQELTEVGVEVRAIATVLLMDPDALGKLSSSEIISLLP
ncbi:MAG: hypothetical protein J7L55_01740 [Desulfurococcales archaeon]|nr:hypothetical protein [Desulfurococcales archaeon]